MRGLSESVKKNIGTQSISQSINVCLKITRLPTNKVTFLKWEDNGLLLVKIWTNIQWKMLLGQLEYHQQLPNAARFLRRCVSDRSLLRWRRMTPCECHETPKLHSMIWQNDGNCLYILKNILLHTFLGSCMLCLLCIGEETSSYNSHKQSCYSYDIWILFKLTLTVLLLP